MASANIVTFLEQNLSLAVVGMMALAIPLVPVDVHSSHWHGLRSAVFEASSATLVLFMGKDFLKLGRGRYTETIASPPFCFLFALLGFGILSLVFIPAKLYAAHSLLMLGSGLLVMVATSVARTDAQYIFLIDVLISSNLLMAFTGFACYWKDRVPLAQGLFHDHMLYGAALLMPLPIILSVSLSPTTLLRRLLAQVSLLSGIVALALAGTRSSWIGGGVAAIVFLGLQLYVRVRQRHPTLIARQQHSRRLQSLVSAIAVLCAIIYFFLAVPVSSQVLARLASLGLRSSYGKTSSVEWRMAAWRGALEMTEQKPLFGWGVGCYPLYQHNFTGTGRSLAQLTAKGPTILDEAHNSYLQLLVEEGITGLLLWIGAMISVFVIGVRGILRFKSQEMRQQIIVGSLSALAGQIVDAVANPGWEFGEVALFLWIVLGLTVNLTLRVTAKQRDEEFTAVPPILSRIEPALTLAIAFGILWLIIRIAPIMPAPIL